jgi:hypothetical protein
MVTKEECTETTDTVCGYIEGAGQALAAPGASQAETGGMIAALVIAGIVGVILLALLVAGAVAALLVVRKLKHKNNMLEGLAMDHLALHVEEQEHTAVMGEAIDMNEITASLGGSGFDADVTSMNPLEAPAVGRASGAV